VLLYDVLSGDECVGRLVKLRMVARKTDDALRRKIGDPSTELRQVLAPPVRASRRPIHLCRQLLRLAQCPPPEPGLVERRTVWAAPGEDLRAKGPRIPGDCRLQHRLCNSLARSVPGARLVLCRSNDWH
jgi:hypothetical protein